MVVIPAYPVSSADTVTGKFVRYFSQNESKENVLFTDMNDFPCPGADLDGASSAENIPCL